MPRFPEASPHAVGIRTATFSGFGARLAAGVRAGKVVPLHLGDVHHLPPAAARALDLDDPFLHRYGPVCGLPALRRAGAEDLRTLGLEVGEEEVFVTAGATGGLDLALNAVCAPGDEVLVLTPTWPLLLGLLQRRG
ncbi:MAG: aminotransferase class I/II-fold pyridoxal phosphate-dependent enzyme, partial [Planctomycetota bacterium]